MTLSPCIFKEAWQRLYTWGESRKKKGALKAWIFKAQKVWGDFGGALTFEHRRKLNHVKNEGFANKSPERIFFLQEVMYVK